MKVRNHGAIVTLTLSVVAAAFIPAAGHAFTLHRIAATIDVSGLASATTGATAVALSEFGAAVTSLTVLPASAELSTASTELRIGLPEAGEVEIEVLDPAGQRVYGARMHMPAGWQRVGFSGRDDSGNALPNGIYHYNVITDDGVLSTKIVINR